MQPALQVYDGAAVVAHYNAVEILDEGKVCHKVSPTSALQS